jgi:fructose-1,6-bisphosphatase
LRRFINNIDVNVSVSCQSSVLRCLVNVVMKVIWAKGFPTARRTEQVAAGYTIYGPQTVC